MAKKKQVTKTAFIRLMKNRESRDPLMKKHRWELCPDTFEILRLDQGGDWDIVEIVDVDHYKDKVRAIHKASAITIVQTAEGHRMELLFEINTDIVAGQLVTKTEAGYKKNVG